MEPFSIQCDSCQANLKVAKASLIGKRLPCPKCGALVMVSPPSELAESTEGTPPYDSDSNTSSEEPLIGVGFEDVDDLLSQLPAKPKQTEPRKPKPAVNPPEPAVNPPEPAVNPPEPITAAAASWDNPAATKARRVLGWVAASVGAILLLGIGAYAWVNQKPAAAPAEAAASTEPEPKNTETDAVSEAQTTPADNQLPSETQVATDPIETVNADAKQPQAVATIMDSAPPPIEFADPISSQPPAQRPSVTSPIAVSPVPDPTSAAPGAGNSEPSVPTDNILQPVAPAKSAFSELASLLEDSGSSISAITDATAAVVAADTVGLPKYYFQATRSAPADVQRQLSQPCDGLRYNNVSLINILRDITLISGVPITIDTQSIARQADSDSQQRLIPTVSVNIADTDFRDAIQQCAEQAGWTTITTETGVVATQPDANSVTRKKIDLTPISKLGDQGLDGMVDAVKAMVASESWFAEADRFQIERNGVSLNVQHLPEVVRQVDQFISKISAAMRLESADASQKDSLKKMLATRLSQAAPNLAASCELPISSRGTLDDLLGRIRGKSGVDVIANWETLATLDWSPQPTVPGNVSEPTLDLMVRQLERSMGSTAIVLDAQTIELTSPIDASQRSYFEFYLISDLFEKNFSPQRTLQLVQEAIQNASQRTATKTIYEPSCRCIILAAPQSTHRVVETVLFELRQLK